MMVQEVVSPSKSSTELAVKDANEITLDGVSRLTAPESADVERSAHEALARQSVAGIYALWALGIVVFGATSFPSAHVMCAAAAGVWLLIVGGARLWLAKAFARLYPRRPLLWRRLFAVALVLSSLAWGIGGAAVVGISGLHSDSRLMLMTLAGIAAGGTTSLAADRTLVRLHVGCLLVPVLATAFIFPASVREAVGFSVIVAAFVGFLLVQGEHAHRAFVGSLTTAKLLERQATALDAARLESVEASRIKSEFLANMSHEIRTPMTAVIGYADLLMDSSLGPSERVNHLQTIRRNGQHLMSLINDILDISKIEAGKMTLESLATSPSQIIVDIASLMRVRAVQKNLSFEIRYLGLIPETITSDPTRLKQIVMNFVGNAIKFTDSGGVRILVRCDEPSSASPRLVVDVADTGIGMTPAQLSKLFESFAQADASTTRKFGGSGLGLVISKRLAELLGGTISVESSLGRGTVFSMSVPTGSLAGVKMIEGLAEAGLEDVPTRSSDHIPILRPGCRVLLAEDGVDNQLLIQTYLVKAGAVVKVVSDGVQAVEAALAALSSGAPYDVILMDMQMPELDGYGATSKLRLLQYDRPIIALTAHAMAGDRARCEKAGCDEYLTKPVNRSLLVGMVARFAGSESGRGPSVELPGPEEAGGPERPSVPLVSSFQDDADMQEIVYQFVRDLPDRSSAILRASQADDVGTLKRLAHQLSGAAGGYGFAQITDAARAVEHAITEGASPLMLRDHVEQLARLCRRARAS